MPSPTSWQLMPIHTIQSNRMRPNHHVDKNYIYIEGCVQGFRRKKKRNKLEWEEDDDEIKHSNDTSDGATILIIFQQSRRSEQSTHQKP